MRWAFWGMCLMMAGTAWAEVADITQFKVLGKANETQVYVFSSPACPHCAAYHQDILPTLKKEIADAGKAQIRLIDMPGDPRSLKAVGLGRCLNDSQYEAYMTAVYRNQAYWLSAPKPDDMLRGYATLAGLSPKEQERCYPNPTLANTIIQQTSNLAQVYRVEALPTTVVVKGGATKMFVGADPLVVPEIIKAVAP